jgi:hypothetical protein
VLLVEGLTIPRIGGYVLTTLFGRQAILGFTA